MEIKQEEGLEASIKIPTSNEDAIQSYLKEKAIQQDMYLIDAPKKPNKRHRIIKTEL